MVYRESQGPRDSADKPRNKEKDLAKVNVKKASRGARLKPIDDVSALTVKPKRSVKFPSGLRLKTVNDKESRDLRKDPAKTPLAYFREKFPKTPIGKIPLAIRKYLRSRYVDNVKIVKITKKDLEKKISKYFKLKDFLKIDKEDKAFMDKKGTWKKYEKYMIHHSDGEYYWNTARIDPNLCKTLDTIRKKAGFPLFVNEGVRPYAYNRDMYIARHGKAKTSSPHVSGRAVDFARTGDPKKDRKMLKAIRDTLSGVGGGIGVGPNIYHVDVKINKGTRPDNGNWIKDASGNIKLRTRDWVYK